MTRPIPVSEALERLSSELGARGVLGELNVVHGRTMVLAFTSRISTKDPRAIFVPSSVIHSASAIVANVLGLPALWLNDPEFKPIDALDLPNLRVQAPAPEYMLAMKVLSDERDNAEDITFLIRLLGLSHVSEVLDIVNRYYDRPPSMGLVEEILEEMHS